MAKVSKESKEEKAEEQQTVDNEVYLADVVQTYYRSGSGGSITICRVLFRHNGRSALRAVEGPVRQGDVLSLRECVREVRRSR